MEGEATLLKQYIGSLVDQIKQLKQENARLQQSLQERDEGRQWMAEFLAHVVQEREKEKEAARQKEVNPPPPPPPTADSADLNMFICHDCRKWTYKASQSVHMPGICKDCYTRLSQ